MQKERSCQNTRKGLRSVAKDLQTLELKRSEGYEQFSTCNFCTH